MITKKYQIIASVDSLVLAAHSSKTFTTKKEAIEEADKLFNAGIPVNFYTDTYENGNCIKNEYYHYRGQGKLEPFGSVNYKVKKRKPDIPSYRTSDYFLEGNDDVKTL